MRIGQGGEDEATEDSGEGEGQRGAYHYAYEQLVVEWFVGAYQP